MSVTLEDDEDEILGLLSDGKPDPVWPAALGIVPASAIKRSLAFVIDALIVLVLTLPLSLGALPLWMGIVLSEPTPSVPAILADPAFIPGLIFYAIGQGLLWIFILVQLLVHGLRGTTVGKAVVGLRSVNVVRFTKPGFWRIFLRAVVFWCALVVIPILGAVPFLLSPLWDGHRRGRGWLDRIGGNWLIDIRRGIDPFDLKALRHARKRALAPEAVIAEKMPSMATGTAGAVPSFVPAGRSSSGVITPRSPPSAPWQPPAIGTPASATGIGDGRALALQPDTSPTVELSFDDGMRVTVTGPGLIGRNPEASAGESFDQLLAIDDESRQISKTHAEFGADDGGFWLLDRGSVNGTAVTNPGGMSRRLAAWQREHVPEDSVVEVGGRSFTVSTTESTR